MKQLTTILCSLAFVVAGAMTIGLKPSVEPCIFPGNMTTYAQPKLFNPDLLKLPLTPQLTLDERTLETRTDTVRMRDTVYVDKPKYIYKQQKVVVPEVVEKHDTLCVPIFFIATPLEYEVESTELITIDEVQDCGCSETNHTSTVQDEQ